MKVRCPECKVKFDVDTYEYDDGDYLNCPECNLELTVEIKKNGKLKVKTTKEKFYEEDEEFNDFEEE